MIRQNTFFISHFYNASKLSKNLGSNETIIEFWKRQGIG